MFNFIKLRLPHPSLRFFLFILFGLVVLILLVEGGYYFWIQRKEEAKWQATDWVNLIEGRINKIDGRTLNITVNDLNSFIPKRAEIEVASNAEIFISPSRKVLKELFLLEEEEFAERIEAAEQPILFTDLKTGDIIQAGSLTKQTKTKFKAESIAVMKE